MWNFIKTTKHEEPEKGGISVKKHIAVFFIVLALVVGMVSGYVLCGTLQERREPMLISAGDTSQFNSEASNASLLNEATGVLELLRTEDYSSLSGKVDPEEGITFTAYSTVNFSSDLHFTQEEFKAALNSSGEYIWGVDQASGDPLRMTASEYLSDFLWDTDYSAAPEIGIDLVIFQGSAQEENVIEAYPDCRVVDFSVPSQTAEGAGFYSLKLVFHRTGEEWYLRGIVHSKAAS